MSSILDNALTSDLTTGSGVVAKLHIIRNILFDDVNQQLTISLDSYLDKDSYLAGLSCLNHGLYQTQASDYSSIVNNTNFIQAIYNYLAGQSDFSGGAS